MAAPVGSVTEGFGIALLPERPGQTDSVILISYESGPAFRVLGHDAYRIEEIDGRSVAGQAASQLAPLFKQAGPKIVVTLRSFADGRLGSYTLNRSKYIYSPLEVWTVNELPVIRIHEFVDHEVAPRFRDALEVWGQRADSLVIDLRYCAGGSFFEALNAVAFLEPPGTALTALQSRGEPRRDFVVPTRSDGTPVLRASVIVLVGPATSSAAEAFVAPLLRDPRFKIMGAPTMGKCLAQSRFALGDGWFLVLSTEHMLHPPDMTCDGPLNPQIDVGAEGVHDPWLLANTVPEIQELSRVAPVAPAVPVPVPSALSPSGSLDGNAAGARPRDKSADARGAGTASQWYVCLGEALSVKQEEGLIRSLRDIGIVDSEGIYFLFEDPEAPNTNFVCIERFGEFLLAEQHAKDVSALAGAVFSVRSY